jgi:hypothetical protein
MQCAILMGTPIERILPNIRFRWFLIEYRLFR